jgi:LmbE family N-acetylglucosaminyl deacetylase
MAGNASNGWQSVEPGRNIIAASSASLTGPARECHTLRETARMAETLVFVHAHPDDEAIATSGTMALAKAAGHRVVLVFATRGELGQAPPDLAPDESLAERRSREVARSAEIIGVDAVHFLGYRDSGMEDDPRIHEAGTFHSAPLEEAAGRLADLLRTEQATIVIGYDERGNYLHPDHVKVHHVTRRARELAGTPALYEATMSRDHIWDLMQRRALEVDVDRMREEIGEAGTIEDLNLGMRAWQITHRVDVSRYVELKRAAMAAHASQIDETSFFLQMPLPAFAESFGWEWFIDPADPRPADAEYRATIF